VPKTIGILQSNYIPWKGYFDIIHSVDEFVLYDDAQFTQRDWRNRNRIKTPDGLKWLTIPVEVKGKFPQKIKDTRISDSGWARKHWSLISANYSKAEYFSGYRELFEELYLACEEEYLSQVNFRFLEAINQLLGITTRISWSSNYNLIEGKNERLVSLCQQAGAKKFLLGPAAQVYLDETLFQQENIEVEWMDYSSYPEYRQLFPPFNHGVTILDLIFNEGPNATNLMKSF
jgi:hypothetical protein